MDLAEWLFYGGTAANWPGTGIGGKTPNKPLSPTPPAATYRPPPAVLGGSIQHYFADPMPAASGAGSQRLIEVTQGSIAAINSVLPVMYGTNLRQGAMVAGMVEYQGMLCLLALVAHGKLRSYGVPGDPIGKVLLDDVPVTTEVYLEGYLGTATQVPSARLAAAYLAKGVTYADAMPGVAYRVICVPADYGLQAFPRVTIEVADGTEVIDVRTGLPVSSNNPVNALADMITNMVYGAGRSYDPASFKVAADFCDEQIGTSTVIPRKRLSLSLTQSTKIDDVITMLASYTGCFIWNTGGRYYLNPLRRNVSVAFFNEANIVASTFRLSHRAMRDQPTTATLNFTDVSITPYHTRPARVEMPAVSGVPSRGVLGTLAVITKKPSFRTSLLTSLVPEIAGSPTPTFTRASQAWVRGYGPLATAGDPQILLKCDANEPRFQGARRVSSGVWSGLFADGATIPDLGGYLNEGARTNLCLQSTAFDAAAWSKVGATASDVQSLAPDGTLTADYLQTIAGNTVHHCTQNVAGASAAYTFSVFAQYVNHPWLALRLSDGTNSFFASFNLQTGTAGAAGAGSSIVALGGGWYRLSVTATVAVSSVLVCLNSIDTASLQVWTATGTEAAYLWGAQLEAGGWASSLILTTTAAVARAADQLTYPLAANFSDANGSVYAEYSFPIKPTDTSRVVGDGAGTGGMPLYWQSNGAGYYDNQNAVVAPAAGSNIANALIRGASAWSAGSGGIVACNGVVLHGAYDGSFNMASVGIGYHPTVPWFGTIRNVTIWPVALNDTEMASITSGEWEYRSSLLPDRNMPSNMPGVTSYEQASHDATEYLNRAIVARVLASWGAFDQAVSVIPGNVVTLHRPKYGLNNQLMLVRDVVDQGFGRYVLDAETYSDDTFSNVVLSAAPPINTVGMVPGSAIAFVGPVTGKEELSQSQSGVWLDVIRFTWPMPANSTALAYFATALYDVTSGKPGVQRSSRNTPTMEYVTEMLQEGHTYRLGVATVSYVGAASDVVWSPDILVLGKKLPPHDVQTLQCTVMDQSVFLAWSRVMDIDLDGYEIRRGTVGQAWASMTFLDHLYSVTDFLANQPQGTWDYAIKARDTSGNFSATEARCPATIQPPDFGVVASHTWTVPEALLTSNFTSVVGTDGRTTFVNTNLAGLWGDGADNPDNTVGRFDDSLRDVVIAAPANAAATMTWKAYDFGATFTGTWTFAGSYQTLYGAGVPTIAYSLDIPATGFALVAHAANRSTDGGATVVTPAIDTTGADLLVLHFGCYNGNPSAPVDNKGNTWIGLAIQDDPAGTRSRLWYAKNPIVGAGHTFTTTNVGASYTGICAAAFKGADLIAPFTVQNGGHAGTGAPPQLVGALTTTTPGALVVTGFCEYDSFTGPFTIDQGFTILDQMGFSSGNAFGTKLAYRLQATVATLNPAWGWTGPGGDARSFGIAAFKFAGTLLGEVGDAGVGALSVVANNTVMAARTAQVDISVPAGTAIAVRDDWRVTCSANVREESGTVAVTGTGVATVLLKGKYSARTSLLLSTGTAGTYATWSNVVLSTTGTNSFQINVVTIATGAAAPATVDWWFKGI